MKILAVDDEPALLERLENIIQKVIPDAETAAFSDADKALEYAQLNSPEVAFLDIALGYMNGVDLAKKIKIQHPLCNIVFCTGYSEYAVSAFEVGASDYLEKPITEEKMNHALINLRHKPKNTADDDKLFVRCFGEFEVFYRGKPLETISKRAKELFAYLVDKQGAMCSVSDITETIFSYLSGSYCRVAKRALTDAFSELGLSDIIISKWGYIAVNAEMIVCDYYEYLKGTPSFINSYNGSYMQQYAWAQSTAGKIRSGS